MVSETINLRIKFQKTGRLQFISHLDLCRTMKTAMIRAKIPIWYSMGFNPHPKMVFSLPLSIGAQSLCEYMDIKLTTPMSGEEVCARLNTALPAELTICEAYEPEMKFSSIGWAEYAITYDCPPDSDVLTDMASKPLVVTKRTKSGDKQIDIQPLIKRFSIKDAEIRALLCADSENYLNPEYIAKLSGIPDYSILRVNVYCQDGITAFR